MTGEWSDEPQSTEPDWPVTGLDAPVMVLDHYWPVEEEAFLILLRVAESGEQTNLVAACGFPMPVGDAVHLDEPHVHACCPVCVTLTEGTS